MAFEFKKTGIADLLVIQPHMYPDDRGLYKKYYEKNTFFRKRNNMFFYRVK